MKKLSIILSLIILSISLHSQTVEESIKTAEKLIKQKKYKEVITKLDKTKNIIKEIYLNELKTELLPNEIENFSVVKRIEEREEIGESFISGNTMQISKTYKKIDKNTETGKKEEREYDYDQTESFVSITISNTTDKFCNVIRLINNSESNYEEKAFKPIKFKGYRAVILDNDNSSFTERERFAAIIGGAVIEINSENLKNNKSLFEYANKLDINKITKYFGK